MTGEQKPGGLEGDASGVEPAHVKVGAAYWRGEVTADQVASTIQDQAAKQTSRPQPSGETREASSDQPEHGALDNRQIVAHIIEAAIVRHGCDPADLEDTLLDADQILMSITPAEPAEARVRELEAELAEQEETIESCKRLIDQHYARSTGAEAQLARMREALEKTRDPLSTAKMWAKRKGGCDAAIDKIDRALFSVKQALQQAGEVG